MDFINRVSLLFMKLKLSFALCLILILIQGVLTSSSNDDKITKIGVILDTSSRLGKEQHIAIQIAIEYFNQTDFGISTHFIDYNQTSLQTAIAAEALVKQKKVEVIIVGIDNWQTTSIVTQIGALYEIPILSLATSPPTTAPFPSLQWPFLVQLSHNATQQVRNIASVIKIFHWRRVIVVYEDDTCSGAISLLINSLQNTRARIEQHLVLPPFTLSKANNPRDAVKKELQKVVDEQSFSRVFIVLKISLSYVKPLFEEAKEMGLMRNDSVWITSESITNFLPSFENSTLLNMNGVIGIMAKFDNSTSDYQEFEAKFWFHFSKQYENEIYHEPSYEALLSFDAINVIVKAKHRLLNNTSAAADSKSRSLLNDILKSNFTGLSGQVLFNHDHNMAQNQKANKLVNVVGANYYNILDFPIDDVEDDNTTKSLANKVNWPGKRVGRDVPPKGWKMPTYKQKMKIGVPIANTYRILIDYDGNYFNFSIPSSHDLDSIHNNNFHGYCIDIFKMVVKNLDYELPYQLIPLNASYNELVNYVHNKTFDAAIGDITILADRVELVDFTFPYAETGLSMVYPVQDSCHFHGPWIFINPFTLKMWVLTFFVFIYTMIVIWILEHGHNSDFQGTWKNQTCTTTWFVLNTIYSAQRENISSKLARVVVILWLFIVLILTQSYTANLTSMMTNDRLNQGTADIEMLKRSNAKVGYDNSSFMERFLINVLRFEPHNVVGMKGDFGVFHQGFQDKTTSVVILEDLYAQIFVTKYCNQYMMNLQDYRFGGFGFMFPKGSPIAVDVSEVILNLTEKDELKNQSPNLNINDECTSVADDSDINGNNSGQQNSLSLSRFKILFSMSGATTTLCLLASFVPWYRRRRRNQQVVVPLNN